MVNVSIARRYARALVDVAGTNADRVLEQLSALVGALDESRELRDVVSNPAFTRAERSAVLDSLLKAWSGLEASLVNLLKLLLDRDKLALLPDIARLYRDLVDAKSGRLRGKVVSAVALPAEALGQLEASLKKLAQREVTLEARVDPSVLGGVAAQVGPVLYDGTLKTQLEEMRRSFLRRA